MTNMSGDAYIIARRTTEGATEAMIGPNIFSATLGGALKSVDFFGANETGSGHTNIAAQFEVSGATPAALGESGRNYATYAPTGMAMLNEALLNGRADFTLNLNAGHVGDTTRSTRRCMTLSESVTPTLDLLACQ